MGEKIKMTGSELAKLLGINSNIYARKHAQSHDRSFLNAGTALSVFTVYDGLPSGIQPINDGSFRTGEIWKDELRRGKYLYLGKLPAAPGDEDFSKDVVISLGGGTSDAGKVLMLHVNYVGEIFFDKRIFPAQR